MFLAIADDLSGAAEIGGVAHRYGLRAEVGFRTVPPLGEGAVVVATDTRGKPPEDAAREVASLAGKVTLPPGWEIFKKVDSVLRGPVVAELSALMAVSARRRALLVPCNPGLGRTIYSGRYWIDGKPIDQTDFHEDPDHPARSAEILEMLNPPPGSPAVQVVAVGHALPPSGILVGEARNSQDVERWAERLDQGTLAAGGSEFFAAVLKWAGLAARPSPSGEQHEWGTVLIVSGSASSASREQVAELERRGVPVLRMPPELYGGGPPGAGALIGKWADLAVKALAEKKRAVVTIGRPVRVERQRTHQLSLQLGEVAEAVLSRLPVQHLWVEGGATASVLVSRLGWRRLEVLRELTPGAVLLRPWGENRPALLLKPGSYRWPDALQEPAGKW